MTGHGRMAKGLQVADGGIRALLSMLLLAPTSKTWARGSQGLASAPPYSLKGLEQSLLFLSRECYVCSICCKGRKGQELFMSNPAQQPMALWNQESKQTTLVEQQIN